MYTVVAVIKNERPILDEAGLPIFPVILETDNFDVAIATAITQNAAIEDEAGRTFGLRYFLDMLSEEAWPTGADSLCPACGRRRL